jgi:hypothetical protein
LAGEHMNFTPAAIEVDIGERQDAGEALREGAYFQEERLVLTRRRRRGVRRHIRIRSEILELLKNDARIIRLRRSKCKSAKR